MKSDPLQRLNPTKRAQAFERLRDLAEERRAA